MIPLRIAVALLLLGALIALLGSSWAAMTPDQRSALAGLMFVGVLVLMGLEPLRRGRGD